MVIGHHKLKSMVGLFLPKDKPYKIGASSIDVCIGYTAIDESGLEIDLSAYTEEVPWLMEPGQFLLVAMKEHVVVPKGMSCLFLLKSTQARKGMSHCFAGWIDPGWDGTLTMELKNYNQFRPLELWPGMPIGQLVYLDTDESGRYAGRYQHSVGVVPARTEVDYDAGE